MMRKQVYECDRCENTVSVELGRRPEGWTLLKVQPVRAPGLVDFEASIKDAFEAPMHLCIDCTSQLLAWLSRSGLLEAN